MTGIPGSLLFLGVLLGERSAGGSQGVVAKVGLFACERKHSRTVRLRSMTMAFSPNPPDPTVRDDFPPLRATGEVRRSRLPVQLTSFVGRTEQIAATGDLLREVSSGCGVDRADGEFEGALLFVENVDRSLADA